MRDLEIRVEGSWFRVPPGFAKGPEGVGNGEFARANAPLGFEVCGLGFAV